MISEREVAKTLTLIERDPLRAKEIVSKYPERDYFVVGITGSPGSGKSTMTDKLAEMFAMEKDVAIIAVDPTSAFTGGAFLGDRIRMRRSARRKNIFIRSMASRGAVGGLSPGIYDAVEFLGRVGYDIIFVETVGVGQSETDIVNLADLVLLILAPGSGDDVQMLKAGIMEIGDIYVVNKQDLDGSQKLLANIEATLKLSGIDRDVISTNSVTGENIDNLKKIIQSHLTVLSQTEKLKKNRKDRYRFNLLNTLFSILRTSYKKTEDLEKIINFYASKEEKDNGSKKD
ncbi:MAG: methylmalonyl Co-A mutase-associated GTPase MeaB [Kosmotoga sp.]|nr:MAG: methylmalonyl Co-A mutase-associated GTPase MeaB [Kosmotoga sp.]